METKQPGYVLYEGTLLGIPCRFLYPSGWAVREISGENYAEVFVAGPRDRTGNYTIAFTVVVTASPQQTAENAAEELLTRYSTMPGFEELGREDVVVAGYPAIEIDFKSSMPLPPNGVNPQWVQVRQKRILLKHGDDLWELYYEAPEDDYEAWLDAFHTLFQNFALSESSDYRVSYAGASEPVPQRVGEDGAHYRPEGGVDDESPHGS